MAENVLTDIDGAFLRDNLSQGKILTSTTYCHSCPELCQEMSTADLVILEGMGRAVHTNLYARFKVDSVKMAVLKNEWLAKSLGAKHKFSVIFRYESGHLEN